MPEAGSFQPDAKDLLMAARQGEQWAVHEIVRLVRHFSRVVCRHDASYSSEVGHEDVAQEALQSLFDGAIDRYVPRGTPSSYLYTVVRYTRARLVRSNSRRLLRDTVWLDRIAAKGGPESRTQVVSILPKLGEACRQLLERVFLNGECYADLANSFKIEESSVRSRVARCIREARRMAEEQ